MRYAYTANINRIDNYAPRTLARQTTELRKPSTVQAINSKTNDRIDKFSQCDSRGAGRVILERFRTFDRGRPRTVRNDQDVDTAATVLMVAPNEGVYPRVRLTPCIALIRAHNTTEGAHR